MPPGAREEGGRRSVEGRERAISQEGLMGYWALKGCEGLAGRLYVGRGRGRETYAETGDEDVYFLLRVVRGIGG